MEKILPRHKKEPGSQRSLAPFKGFTLIEVIIASVIFSLIAAALGSLFWAGLSLWKRVHFERIREEATLAFTGMVDRREASKPFSLIKISDKPAPNEFVFPGLVKGKSGVKELGQVRYWVSSEGRLLRGELTFPALIANEEEKTVEVAHSIEGLKVEDLYFNSTTGKFQKDPILLGQMSKEIIPKPAALRLRLEFKTVDEKSHSLERIFQI